MAQAVLRTEDGQGRLAITVAMLEALVASGTIEDPQRVELIEGELSVCSFVSRCEGRVRAKLLCELGNLVSPDFEVLARVSVRLDEYNEPMPDICIARAGVTTDVLYPPDCMLVIEVSESTVRQDRNLKAALYAKASIQEYWVVDLNAAETVVHRGPSEAGWEHVKSVQFSSGLTALFDSNINIVVADL
jgi:Uma2 family endonuclease